MGHFDNKPIEQIFWAIVGFGAVLGILSMLMFGFITWVLWLIL